MKRREALWTQWAQIAVASSLLVAGAFGIVAALHADPMTTLRLDVEELRSRAHESLELVKVARQQAVNATYVRGQTQQFATSIDDLSVALSRSHAPHAAEALDAARALAMRVRDMALTTDDPEQLAAVANRIQDVVARVDELAVELGK